MTWTFVIQLGALMAWAAFLVVAVIQTLRSGL